MTLAGVSSPPGGPSKITIVPITKKTTYNTPPRMVQRATLRGRPTATAAASMEPPSECGRRCPRIEARFSLHKGSPFAGRRCDVVPRARRLQLTPQLGLPGEKAHPEGDPGHRALS